VKIVFYDWDQFSAPDKMFHLWFNTGFIDNNYLLFHKDVLDRACKDKACKEFDPEFKIEIFLDKARCGVHAAVAAAVPRFAAPRRHHSAQSLRLGTVLCRWTTWTASSTA